MRIVSGLFFGLLLTIGATGPGPAKAVVPDDRKCGVLAPADLLARSYNFDRAKAVGDSPAELPSILMRDERLTNLSAATPENLARELRQAPSGGQVVLYVKRPEGVSEKDWEASYAYGAAQTEEKGADRKSVATRAMGVSFRDRNKNSALLDARLPEGRQGASSEDWTIVAVICGGQDNKVLGYGSAKLILVSSNYAFWVTAISVAVFWFLISLATFQFYKDKLNTMWDDLKSSNQRSWLSKHEQAKPVWLCLQSANPLFISQDSLGYASLARFQILLFTTVVGGVLLYIFVHSGVLSELSNTVLTLLGITLAGGTLGRAVGDWSEVKQVNRQWLIGSGILKPQPERPRWSDLLTTQGEIDVAKVQALLFTLLIAISIVSRSYTGLGSFTVPEQIMYLAAISQGAYVFGKLIPSDTRKKIDQDIDALRVAAVECVAKPNAPELMTKFEWARAATKTTLLQTYGEKLEPDQYDKATSDPKLVI